MSLDTIRELVNSGQYALLKSELALMRAADIAEFLDELEPTTALVVFRLLPKDAAAMVFAYLSHERQTSLSQLANEVELSSIMEALFFDDKIDFLEEMPANVVNQILRNSPESERRLINQFLNYPENSAGSLMTIEYVALRPDQSAGEALARIRQIAPRKETIYTCYVTDSERRLTGTVSLRDLVIADPETTVGQVMRLDPIRVTTHDDQEHIAGIFKKYDLLAIPVVDGEDRLVGIITIDDIVDVIDQETTEDFHRMAALVPSDEEYLNTSIMALARKRIVWLLVLMVSATFTGYIIRSFETTLASVVALATFIPMLMDTGGNAGSQASTLVIRSLILREIELRDMLKVIWKEMQVSLLVGVGLAALNFVRIRFFEGYSTPIALTVSATLVTTVMLAKILGGVLPMVAQRLRLDPAIMAGPLITTIVDAVALVVYFYLARWFIGITV
ncbi:MAG: magnesium transporter [Bacillota bacterium]